MAVRLKLGDRGDSVPVLVLDPLALSEEVRFRVGVALGVALRDGWEGERVGLGVPVGLPLSERLRLGVDVVVAVAVGGVGVTECVPEVADPVCVQLPVKKRASLAGTPSGHGLPPPPPQTGGGGVGMLPWGLVLICSWRRPLADHGLLPFPWTLFLYSWWCPSFSSLPYLSLSTSLSFPLAFPSIPRGGGGGMAARAPPPDPPTHTHTHQKKFPQEKKMKFINGARNWRSNLFFGF